MLTEVSFTVRMWLQVVSQEVVHRSSSFVRIKPKASFQARRSLGPTVVPHNLVCNGLRSEVGVACSIVLAHIMISPPAPAPTIVVAHPTRDP